MAEITNLYSYKGADPHPLPERLRLSDGTTRTDPSTFTNAEITDAGFTGPYTRPDVDDQDGMIGWNSEKLEYEVTMFDNDQWMARRKAERNKFLSDTDYTQMPDSPMSAEDKQSWANYRQALRDWPANSTDAKNDQFPVPADFFGG